MTASPALLLNASRKVDNITCVGSPLVVSTARRIWVCADAVKLIMSPAAQEASIVAIRVFMSIPWKFPVKDRLLRPSPATAEQCNN